ncbi:hypothetical protein BABINDRAFT_163403, partial [Babjeviella inositovora NRRL Y-12698]
MYNEVSNCDAYGFWSCLSAYASLLCARYVVIATPIPAQILDQIGTIDTYAVWYT